MTYEDKEGTRGGALDTCWCFVVVYHLINRYCCLCNRSKNTVNSSSIHTQEVVYTFFLLVFKCH